MGDTVTIKPKISIIVEDSTKIDQIIRQFGEKISFKNKIGRRIFVYNCNVNNSDEVLEITTILAKNKDVIGCGAFTNFRMELFNTLYPKQYYLHDTSSGSIGINMESAWELASGLGQGITVAVIDAGVDHNHEDLTNVLDGYTVGDLSGKGDPINTNSVNSHGMACAGIIGADNNSIGIKGIASNVKILPVNIFISDYYDDEYAAKAILWASERADVISCSWGNRRGDINPTLIETLNEVMTEGRNGKGCVVVFASGNFAQTFNNLAFPASVEGVISVGAVDKTGKIWNYSQRGKGLSLVAPSGNGNSSSDIVTTDRMGNLGYDTGNYTEHFNGTSAACPQVAGVAALMLSIRPDLTAAEVKDVLQRTATDLGATGYDTTYGYGLLNAYAAVNEIISISGSSEAKSNNIFRIDNLQTNSTVTWSVDEKDKDKIKLTLSGEGGKTCKAELVGTKTVKTKLTAVVKHGDITVATLTKNITLIGTLYGTYSVTASTVNGVSLPAIVNRPFYAGSTLEGHPGSTITINSDDFQYYSVVRSGSAVQGWTVGLDFIRFSYPVTAAGAQTRLEFTGKTAGTAKLQVYVVGPTVHSINIFRDGEILGVRIIKEEQDEWNLYEAEEISRMSVTEPSDNVWTIEVLNVTTGAIQDKISTPTGEYQFDTSRWQSGIYIVRASNGIETISKKITIK